MEKKLHSKTIVWDYYDDIADPKVKKEQKRFIVSNSESLIDAYFALTEEGIKSILYIFIAEKNNGLYHDSV